MKTRTKKQPASPFPPATRAPTKGEAFALAGSLGKSWKPISEALDRAEGASTCFLDFNLKSGINGIPLRRITTIHGPTHEGKSLFLLGLLKSFAEQGHIAAYIDAEHATPEDFVDGVLGELTRRPNVVAMRPTSYEDVIEAVRTLLAKVTELRKSNPDLRCIIGVDSINKLVPKRELEILSKQNAGESINKGHGRLRAGMNQAWLDWLTVTIPDANCAMVAIAQEREEETVGNYTRFDEEFRPKGGQALKFDAGMIIRITKGAPIKSGDDILGFTHRVRIYKNKLSAMEGRASTALFFTSLGKVTPAGIDYYRDALNVGKQLDVLKVTGAWITFGKRRWQGEYRALLDWTKDPYLFAEIKTKISEAIEQRRALSHSLGASDEASNHE